LRLIHRLDRRAHFLAVTFDRFAHAAHPTRPDHLRRLGRADRRRRDGGDRG